MTIDSGTQMDILHLILVLIQPHSLRNEGLQVLEIGDEEEVCLDQMNDKVIWIQISNQNLVLENNNFHLKMEDDQSL